MLTNISYTPLQAPTSTMVWDALLKDFKKREPKPEVIAGEYDEFVGVYMANFAAFKDAEFTVSTKQGLLYVDIPGQTNFELAPPDDEDLRAIMLAPSAKFKFVRNAKGKMNTLELHQGGAIFAMLRKGVKADLDLPLEELEPFFGMYDLAAFKSPVEVKIQNGHLAADLPGQMVVELKLPNEEGIWMFRPVPNIGIEFEFDDDGEVVALILHEKGKEKRGEKLKTKVREKPVNNDLPSLVEINELRGMQAFLDARAKLGNLQRQGSINFVHTGIIGSMQEVDAPDASFYNHTVMGKFGYSNTGYDGTTAWSDTAFDSYDEPKGMMLDQVLLGAPYVLHGDWEQSFDQVEVMRSASRDGSDYWVINLTRGSLPPMIIYLNQETGDIERMESRTVAVSGSKNPVTASFGDFREQFGLRLPFMLRTESDAAGATVVKIENMQANVKVDAKEFAPKK
jgi:hypothetical protein